MIATRSSQRLAARNAEINPVNRGVESVGNGRSNPGSGESVDGRIDSGDDELEENSGSSSGDTYYTADGDSSYCESENSSSDVVEISPVRPKKPVSISVVSDDDTSEGYIDIDDATDEHRVQRPALTNEEQDYFAQAMEIVNNGDLKKLTIEQSKAYLRNFGLRLSGTKSVLIERIEEHLEIKDRGGITKYPRWTFNIDCTGDACKGDVVLFKQYVYDRFDLASRSSANPPLGKRVVAGCILKESYGVAKQQHTFTVEVLWSMGMRPLPPLCPLIIKGRNLYRFRTFRQPWLHEDERKRILKEKHSRGATARDIRVARKESKKARKLRCSEQGGAKALCADGAIVTTNHRKIAMQQPTNQGYVNLTLAGGTSQVRAITSGPSAPPTTQLQIYGGMNCDYPVSILRMNINTSFAGLVIGRHGTNINEITGVTGAKLHIREDKTNSSMRVLEIIGTPEQIEHAKQMVLQRAIPSVSKALQRINPSTSKVSQRTVPSQSTSMQRNIPSKSKICRHFASGKCRFGNACRFSHG